MLGIVESDRDEGGTVKEGGLVSVITPAFNAEEHLAETIESCLAQTYGNFELLLVDDGSRDGTAAIAHRFASADRRIHVFCIPNGGAAAARNVAIARARGELFALLDSDDCWMPTYLEHQVGTLFRHPSVDVVSANAINRGGDFDGEPFWPASAELRPIDLLDMIVREDALHIFSVFRRIVVDRVGNFDPAFGGNEDYHFWLRAATAGCRFLADFTPRGYYRRRAGSVSADQRRMLVGIMRVLQQAKQWCPDGGPERKAIDAQLRRFTRELWVAEARECIAVGDSIRGVECLKRIPPVDRGRALSALVLLAGAWPPILSHSYRAKQTLRELRGRLSTACHLRDGELRRAS